MRILLKTLFLFVITCSFVINLDAQKPTIKKPVTTSTKFKPPKLYTFLTTYKDSVSVPAAVAAALVGASLKIYDDKKTEYAVSSYQFLYKKKTVTEGETDGELNGKASPATSIASDRFKTTPLPALWINKIREDIKAGDELYFFDVIAKDAKGTVMYASTLKITVQ